MGLTREQIVEAIASREVEVEEVDVPEWGGEVYIRRMTAADLEAAGLMDPKPPPDVTLRVISICLADEDGKPLFGIKQKSKLATVDAVLTLKLFAECARINGLMTAELEEMMAGFGPARSDDSSSS